MNSQIKHGAIESEKIRMALQLQDAYWYVRRALNDADGTFHDTTPGLALKLAWSHAKAAGLGVNEGWGHKAPRKLADAVNLYSAIVAFASAHGIDASTREAGDS